MSQASTPSTTLEKLNAEPELLEAMLSMPLEANREMVENRREEMFDFLWTVLDLDKQEMLGHIEDREDQLLEGDLFEEGEGGPLPEWLCRMEAQDLVMEMLYEKYKEEDIIEGDVNLEAEIPSLDELR